MIVGSLISFGLINASGFDAVGFISSLSPESSTQERNLARWANLLPHLFAFTGGAIAAALIFFGRNWRQQLGLKVLPTWQMIGGGLLFMLGTFPFVQTTYWINQQLPLPAWMKEMEVNANELIKIILHMDGPAELLLNLLTVGVVAAVGEELVFRGILQQQLSRVIQTTHPYHLDYRNRLQCNSLTICRFFAPHVFGGRFGVSFLLVKKSLAADPCAFYFQ